MTAGGVETAVPTVADVDGVPLEAIEVAAPAVPVAVKTTDVTPAEDAVTVFAPAV